MRKNLVPAYGRDYKNVKAVMKDFDDGKDFIISDISDRYDGKPCNKQDLIGAGVTGVQVRYGNLRKVTSFPVKK